MALLAARNKASAAVRAATPRMGLLSLAKASAAVRAATPRLGLLSLAARRPIAFGAILSGAKTCLADGLVQVFGEGKEVNQIDWRRNAVFGSFGFCYLGCFQYWVYVRLFAHRLFPSAAQFVSKSFTQRLKDRAGQRVVLAQVALDQLVHHPLIWFPTFYMVKSTSESGDPLDGLRLYAENWKEDLPACWSVWVPAFMVNFSVMPLWGRVPFVAIVSLLWMGLVSSRHGKKECTGGGGQRRAGG